MVIYTVTAVDGLDAPSHCVGWFSSLEAAMKATKENKMDFSECGSYQYAVVEKVHEGLPAFAPSDEQKWFKCIKKEKDGNLEDIVYEECNVPKEYKNISNFSIG